MAYNVELIFTARRRFWLIVTAVTLTVLWTWSSVSRLSELVEENKDGGDQSLFRLAERNVLEHLPTATGFRGDLSAASAVTLGGGGSRQQQLLVAGAPDSKAATTTAEAGIIPGALKPGRRAGRVNAHKTQPIKLEEGVVSADGQCKMWRNMDFWGEALVWGAQHKMDSVEECCKACRAYKPESQWVENLDCNVWVYCEDEKLCGEHYKECWLKHMAHPEASKPAREGPGVGWTTGFMISPDDAKEVASQDPSDDRKFHVVITAQGSAVHWQARVHYYWYKKIRAQCEAAGNCQMGGFTRLLHSGVADELMGEIPSYVVNPLPPEHPNHGYVVLNRPYALLQWIQQVKIPEKYVLMSEPDHIWLKPMPNLMKGQRPFAFPFFYIEPWKKEYIPLTARFIGPITRKEAEQIAPIGNAPTVMSWEDMKKVMPIWFNMSIAIHNDKEAAKEWGWVQEMYAFTLSCTKAGIKKIDLYRDLMAQPPYDTKLSPYYLLHFTYGNDYDLDGNFTPGKYGAWRFDKRTYHQLPPPRNLPEPPKGMQNELVRHLIFAINEASSKIPGWDEYAKTGKATQFWDGKLT